jgi:hypothetical protein
MVIYIYIYIYMHIIHCVIYLGSKVCTSLSETVGLPSSCVVYQRTCQCLMSALQVKIVVLLDTLLFSNFICRDGDILGTHSVSFNGIL